MKRNIRKKWQQQRNIAEHQQQYVPATGVVLIIPGDTSCTTEERAANDEETASGADVDDADKIVLEYATVDENSDVVCCISVFDETPGVNNEPLDDDTGVLDDISCTTEEVTTNDE